MYNINQHRKPRSCAKITCCTLEKLNWQKIPYTESKDQLRIGKNTCKLNNEGLIYNAHSDRAMLQINKEKKEELLSYRHEIIVGSSWKSKSKRLTIV